MFAQQMKQQLYGRPKPAAANLEEAKATIVGQESAEECSPTEEDQGVDGNDKSFNSQIEVGEAMLAGGSQDDHSIEAYQTPPVTSKQFSGTDGGASAQAFPDSAVSNDQRKSLTEVSTNEAKGAGQVMQEEAAAV